MATNEVPSPTACVAYVGSPSAWRLELRNPSAIAARVGDRVFAALLKCFCGIDRILTLEHLMHLVVTAERELPPSHPAAVDEAAYTRDRTHVGFQLASTLHEMGEALQQLCNVIGPSRELRELDTWAPLDAVRAQWHTQPISSQVRNQLGAHLGNREHYVAAVQHMTTETIMLYETTGDRRHFGRYTGASELLFRELGIDGETFRTFVERQFRTHDQLPELFFAFLRDVLIARGVPIVDERVR